MRALLRRFAGESLESRIAASSSALAFMTVVLFGTFAYVSAGRAIEERIADAVAQQDALIAHVVEDALAEHVRDVAALAANTLVGSGIADSTWGRDSYLQPFLREHRLAGDESTLALCDFRGSLVAISHEKRGDPCGALADVGLLIARGRPVADLQPATGTLTVAYPVVFRGTGQIEGAVVASSTFARLLEAASRSVPADFLFGLTDGASRTVAGKVAASSAGTALRLPEPLDAQELRLHLTADPGKLYAPLRRLAMVYLALGIVLAIGINLLARRMARRIAMPVRVLADAALRLGRDVRAPVTVPESGSAEIARLSAAFGEMQARLRESYDDLDARVRQRTAQLDAIFSLSPDGFVMFGADGRLAYVNPAFLGMTGMAADTLMGMEIAAFDWQLASLCAPSKPCAGVAALLEPPSEGNATSPYGDTLHLVRPVQRALARRLRVGPAGWPEVVLYFRDVTRELEVDAMKSEFLSTAAHELRTPMASIFGFSELLLQRRFDEDTRRDLLQTIYRQSRLLTDLVNELLDLARIEARQGKDFVFRRQPLEPILSAALAGLLVPGDTRSVGVRMGARLPEVHVDQAKLERALLNLLSNAYKYSPEGGPIVLEAEAQPMAGRDGVMITVADRGIGMTPEQLARAFDRFWRADRSGAVAGTGLGLSIVKEIVQLHGGSIRLESVPGKGTKACVWLPAADLPPVGSGHAADALRVAAVATDRDHPPP